VSVSALNALAREWIESRFGSIRVAGEVADWKRHPSGHCWFVLRDASAQVRCVMFRAEAQRLAADPDTGMQVRALGTLTLYEKRGEYQLVVRDLELTEPGGLVRLAFERLRAKLDSEGLFDPARKRPLPRYPRAVGIVTSATGAALQDILEVIGKRAPWVRVVLAPARVQGEGAPVDIARALRRFRVGGDVDVVIVGRGGGSGDDLSAFDQEIVAREIAACPVPVISAVGHEVDITIADLVADVRAPTPSAAAERAVPDRVTVRREIAALQRRMGYAMRRRAQLTRHVLSDLERRLKAAGRARVRDRRRRLGHLAEKLEALSPLSAMRRGFAVPRDGSGRVLRQTADFRAGLAFQLMVSDGSVPCRVEEDS
jgi:exodeoxyribonuclease VII large subunit